MDHAKLSYSSGLQPTQCVLKGCKTVCLPLGKPTVETQTSLYSMQNANVQITSVKQIQDFVVVTYSLS